MVIVLYLCFTPKHSIDGDILGFGSYTQERGCDVSIYIICGLGQQSENRILNLLFADFVRLSVNEQGCVFGIPETFFFAVPNVSGGKVEVVELCLVLRVICVKQWKITCKTIKVPVYVTMNLSSEICRPFKEDLCYIFLHFRLLFSEWVIVPSLVFRIIDRYPHMYPNLVICNKHEFTPELIIISIRICLLSNLIEVLLLLISYLCSIAQVLLDKLSIIPR